MFGMEVWLSSADASVHRTTRQEQERRLSANIPKVPETYGRNAVLNVVNRTCLRGDLVPGGMRQGGKPSQTPHTCRATVKPPDDGLPHDRSSTPLPL